jgi:hypothetical protein
MRVARRGGIPKEQSFDSRPRAHRESRVATADFLLLSGAAAVSPLATAQAGEARAGRQNASAEQTNRRTDGQTVRHGDQSESRGNL